MDMGLTDSGIGFAPHVVPRLNVACSDLLAPFAFINALTFVAANVRLVEASGVDMESQSAP